MIDQHRIWVACQHVIEQGLNKIYQMVNLFELAAAILIQLAIAREDMQLLEQLYGLIGANFWNICHIDILRQKQINLLTQIKI